MNATTRLCPRCSEALPPAGAIDGLCPRCLLEHGVREPRSAETPRLPTAAELQERIPRLEILHVLGRGGMGAVYKARQPDLDRHVAVKVLRPDLADDTALSDRFVREARNLARLDHPNIVRIHDFGREEHFVYLVMEYVDGSSVRELIDARLLAPSDALAIFPEICEALRYAHEHGVVHRDVKPGNILVDTNGRVKVADFGLSKSVLARRADPTLTHTRQAMGTPHYMAPEQMRRTRDVDHRADIFSLGVLLYEMLTGEVPIGKFEPPSKRAEVDPAIDAVVLRAIDRDPSRRHPSARELGQDVARVSGRDPAAFGGGNARNAGNAANAANAADPTKRAPDGKRAEAPADAARTPESTPAADAEPAISVPFTISGEFHDASGLLTVEGNHLVVEYRKKWGSMFPMKIREIRFPLDELRSAQLVQGVFKQKIRIVPRTMAPFDDLPVNDYDVRFGVKSDDLGLARRMVARIHAEIGDGTAEGA